MALNILFAEIKAFRGIEVLIESLSLSFALIKFISEGVKKGRKGKRSGRGKKKKYEFNIKIYIYIFIKIYILIYKYYS